jgi:hypothetical protein
MAPLPLPPELLSARVTREGASHPLEERQEPCNWLGMELTCLYSGVFQIAYRIVSHS